MFQLNTNKMKHCSTALLKTYSDKGNHRSAIVRTVIGTDNARNKILFLLTLDVR